MDTLGSTLWWNVRKAYGYIQGHTPYLVNYGARYRKGLPISSSIAESAVNEVVSLHMAKKRQMRWSDAGAHTLAQVRVAYLNGELSPRSFGSPTRARQCTVQNNGMEIYASRRNAQTNAVRSMH
jgi:hypothetical protein